MEIDMSFHPFIECLICDEEFITEITQWYEHPCTSKGICSPCMRSHIHAKIESLQIEIKCVCGKLLLESEINRLAEEKFISMREATSIRMALSNMEDYRACPAVNCKGGGLIDKRYSFFLCGSCPMKICTNCGDEHHLGFTCEQKKQWKELNNRGGDLTQQLINSKYGSLYKSCPKCKSIIEKNGGCAHMKCGNCKHEFCWLCNETYYDGHIRDKHTKRPPVRPTIVISQLPPPKRFNPQRVENVQTKRIRTQ